MKSITISWHCHLSLAVALMCQLWGHCETQDRQNNSFSVGWQKFFFAHIYFSLHEWSVRQPSYSVYLPLTYSSLPTYDLAINSDLAVSKRTFLVHLTSCPQRRLACLLYWKWKPEIKREKASVLVSTAHFKVLVASSHVSLMVSRNSGGHY